MLDVVALREESKDPFHIIKSEDGTKIFIREWSAEKISETAVLIFHGITAHSEVYGVIGKPLATAGFTTYGMDLRGHGLSGGPRGDYKNKEQFYSDITATLKFIGSKHKKIILLGHSLGVVTAVMTSWLPNNIHGMVLLSAAREVREGAYPKRSKLTTLKILLSSIFRPSYPIIHYFRDGITGLNDLRFNF